MRYLGKVLLAATLLGAPALQAAAQDEMRVERVAFAAGATGTRIEDRIKGRASVLYKIGAEAGQEMTIDLASSNDATYFNVFAPGSGPGDQALAVGSMTGPLMPDLNRFRGTLPTSGEYSVLVYLYRAAARRGEVSRFTLDITISPKTDLSQPVRNDYADGLQGGPDYWNVRTSGGLLNLRAAPSAGATMHGQLANGTPLRNLGCRMAEGRRWCRVETLSEPAIEGWTAGDFLVEGSGPEGVATQLPDMVPVVDAPSYDAMIPGTNYHARGQIDCYRTASGPKEACDFGVTRAGGGSGTVTVTWPDGATRMIVFDAGTPVDFDRSEADGDLQLTTTREGDVSIVRIGETRFDIFDAVIWGG